MQSVVLLVRGDGDVADDAVGGVVLLILVFSGEVLKSKLVSFFDDPFSFASDGVDDCTGRIRRRNSIGRGNLGTDGIDIRLVGALLDT